MSLLPVLCSYTSLDEDVPLQALDYIGWSMFGVGFLFETIADSQKASFRANSANVSHSFTAMSDHDAEGQVYLQWPLELVSTSQRMSELLLCGFAFLHRAVLWRDTVVVWYLRGISSSALWLETHQRPFADFHYLAVDTSQWSAIA